MSINYTHTIKKLCGFASTDLTYRPELQNIQFDGNVVKATDGHIMAEVTLPSDQSFEDKTLVNASALAGIPVERKSTITRNAESLVVDNSRYKAHVPIIDDKYPDISKVYPKGEPTITIRVNPRLLKKICELAVGQKNQYATLKLTIYTESAGIVYEGVTANGDDIKGLIMPVRLQ